MSRELVKLAHDVFDEIGAATLTYYTPKELAFVVAVAVRAAASEHPAAPAETLTAFVVSPVFEALRAGAEVISDTSLVDTLTAAGNVDRTTAARLLRAFLRHLREAFHADVRRVLDTDSAPPEFDETIASMEPGRWPTPALQFIVEGAIDTSAVMYARGDANDAYRELRRVRSIVAASRHRLPAALAGHFALLYGQAQMQRGETAGAWGARAMSRQAAGAFRESGHAEGLAHAIQLAGLCARQRDDYRAAIRLYSRAIGASEDAVRQTRIRHDLAVSQSRFLAEERHTDDRESYREPERLLRETSAEEAGLDQMGPIRLAELFVSTGHAASARDIFDEYHAERESRLKKPFRAIYLRTFAEWHLHFGSRDEASQLILEALRLDVEEHYHHQMKELAKLVRRHGDQIEPAVERSIMLLHDLLR
jgi:tetratricopeptide (TPR) repeat protein